jgi:hypothetical protein
MLCPFPVRLFSSEVLIYTYIKVIFVQNYTMSMPPPSNLISVVRHLFHSDLLPLKFAATTSLMLKGLQLTTQIFVTITMINCTIRGTSYKISPILLLFLQILIWHSFRFIAFTILCLWFRSCCCSCATPSNFTGILRRTD